MFPWQKISPPCVFVPFACLRPTFFSLSYVYSSCFQVKSWAGQHLAFFHSQTTDRVFFEHSYLFSPKPLSFIPPPEEPWQKKTHTLNPLPSLHFLQGSFTGRRNPLLPRPPLSFPPTQNMFLAGNPDHPIVRHVSRNGNEPEPFQFSPIPHSSPHLLRPS